MAKKISRKTDQIITGVGVTSLLVFWLCLVLEALGVHSPWLKAVLLVSDATLLLFFLGVLSVSLIVGGFELED